MDSKKMLSIVLASLASLNSLASATPKVKNVKVPESLRIKKIPINSRFNGKRRLGAKRKSATKTNPGRRVRGSKSASLVGNFRNVKSRPMLVGNFRNLKSKPVVAGNRILPFAPNGLTCGASGAILAGTIGGGIALGNKLSKNSKKAEQHSEEEILSASTEASGENLENSFNSDVQMVQKDNQISENEVKDSLGSMVVEGAGEKNNKIPVNFPNFSMPMVQEAYQVSQAKEENLPIFNEPIVEENLHSQVKEEEVTHVNKQPEVEIDNEAPVVQKKSGEEAEKEKTKILMSIEKNVSLVFYEYKKNKVAKWFPILEQKMGKDKYSCGALIRFIKSNYNGELEWEDLPVLFDVNGKEHGKMDIYFQKISSSFHESFGYDAVLFDDFKHPDFEKCETKLTKGDIGIFQGAVEYKLEKLFEEHGLEYDSGMLQKRLKKFGLGVLAKYTGQMAILWRDSRIPLFYDPFFYDPRNFQK